MIAMARSPWSTFPPRKFLRFMTSRHEASSHGATRFPPAEFRPGLRAGDARIFLAVVASRPLRCVRTLPVQWTEVVLTDPERAADLDPRQRGYSARQPWSAPSGAIPCNGPACRDVAGEDSDDEAAAP